MTKSAIRLLIGIAGVACVELVNAHTPYISPNAFEPINGGLVTLDASFAERFFVPEVVFDNSEFEVWTPAGKKETPDTVMSLRSRIIVEHDLIDDGTYRFSTGRRIGRVFKVYERDGQRIAREDPDAPVPEGAVLIDHYQSNTLAETYVTRGAPSEAALAPREDGLEFVSLSHPNDLFVGEALELQAQFFGKAVNELTVHVFLASRQFGDDSPVQTLTTSSDGSFSFTPEVEGIYLLRARHRDKAPAGSQAPEFSNTYTLVVEAFN